MEAKLVDPDLVVRAQAGDAESFATLLAPYRNDLFAFLVRASGDTDEAADLLQLTIIRAWKGLPRYHDKGRFGAWLFTLARNVLIDEVRKTKRQQELREAAATPARRVSTDPLADLEARDLEASIQAALNRLPEPRRTVFLMRHHSPMTFQEIAHSLDIPLGTALSHMHHALSALRAALEVHDVTA